MGVGLIVFHKNIMRSFTGEFDKAGAFVSLVMTGQSSEEQQQLQL